MFSHLDPTDQGLKRSLLLLLLLLAGLRAPPLISYVMTGLANLRVLFCYNRCDVIPDVRCCEIYFSLQLFSLLTLKSRTTLLALHFTRVTHSAECSFKACELVFAVLTLPDFGNCSPPYLIVAARFANTLRLTDHLIVAFFFIPSMGLYQA